MFLLNMSIDITGDVCNLFWMDLIIERERMEE